MGTEVKIEMFVEPVTGGWKISINGTVGFAAKYENIPNRVKEMLTPMFPKKSK